MSGKGSGILNKLIVALLFLASIAFFAEADNVDVYVLPGMIFAAAGFVLALRKERRPAAELEPVLTQRLAELSENISAVHGDLAVMQERIDRLTEERDFMRQLAQPAVPRAQVPVRPLEVPAPPYGPELARPDR